MASVLTLILWVRCAYPRRRAAWPATAFTDDQIHQMPSVTRASSLAQPGNPTALAGPALADHREGAAVHGPASRSLAQDSITSRHNDHREAGLPGKRDRHTERQSMVTTHDDHHRPGRSTLVGDRQGGRGKFISHLSARAAQPPWPLLRLQHRANLIAQVDLRRPRGCPSRRRQARANRHRHLQLDLHRRPRSIPLGRQEYARQLPGPGGQDPTLRTRPPTPGNSLRRVPPPSGLLALHCSEQEKAWPRISIKR